MISSRTVKDDSGLSATWVPERACVDVHHTVADDAILIDTVPVTQVPATARDMRELLSEVLTEYAAID